jgi:hypothetical protein
VRWVHRVSLPAPVRRQHRTIVVVSTVCARRVHPNPRDPDQVTYLVTAYLPSGLAAQQVLAVVHEARVTLAVTRWKHSHSPGSTAFARRLAFDIFVVSTFDTRRGPCRAGERQAPATVRVAGIGAFPGQLQEKAWSKPPLVAQRTQEHMTLVAKPPANHLQVGWGPRVSSLEFALTWTSSPKE